MAFATHQMEANDLAPPPQPNVGMWMQLHLVMLVIGTLVWWQTRHYWQWLHTVIDASLGKGAANMDVTHRHNALRYVDSIQVRCRWDHLPKDLIRHIAAFHPYGSAPRMRAVCCSWNHSLAHDASLIETWRQRALLIRKCWWIDEHTDDIRMHMSDMWLAAHRTCRICHPHRPRMETAVHCDCFQHMTNLLHELHRSWGPAIHHWQHITTKLDMDSHTMRYLQHVRSVINDQKQRMQGNRDLRIVCEACREPHVSSVELDNCSWRLLRDQWNRLVEARQQIGRHALVHASILPCESAILVRRAYGYVVEEPFHIQCAALVCLTCLLGCPSVWTWFMVHWQARWFAWLGCCVFVVVCWPYMANLFVWPSLCVLGWCGIDEWIRPHYSFIITSNNTNTTSTQDMGGCLWLSIMLLTISYNSAWLWTRACMPRWLHRMLAYVWRGLPWVFTVLFVRVVMAIVVAIWMLFVRKQ